jgi:hypothetical protein
LHRYSVSESGDADALSATLAPWFGPTVIEPARGSRVIQAGNVGEESALTSSTYRHPGLEPLALAWRLFVLAELQSFSVPRLSLPFRCHVGLGKFQKRTLSPARPAIWNVALPMTTCRSKLAKAETQEA